MTSAVLIERPLLVSSTSFYTFQGWDKMLHFMLIDYLLPCLPGELSALWLHCMCEQDEMFHLGYRSCCLISFKVAAAQALTNQPCCSCHLTHSALQHISVYL